LLPELIAVVLQYLPLEFEYIHDWDKNGVLYWLGTQCGSLSKRLNPARYNLVTISMSGIGMGDVVDICDTGAYPTGCCWTLPALGSWIQVDLGKNMMFQPTAYTLHHGGAVHLGYLRNWRFEASNDGKNWVLLREHVQDTRLQRRSPFATWVVPVAASGSAGYFRYVRILQNGLNQLGTHHLVCRALELYGVFRVV
jgi:E3 ubiquitin-protein ligase HECTD1